MLSNDTYASVVHSQWSLPFRLHSAGYMMKPPNFSIRETVCSEIHVCLRGRGEYCLLSGQQFSLQSEQIFIVPPNTAYEFRSASDPCELAVVRFDCHLSMLLQFRLQLSRPITALSSGRIWALIDLLCKQDKLLEQVFMASETIYALLSEIKLQTTPVPVYSPTPKVTIQKVINYIYTHHADRLTLEKIARVFGYTSQHLNKLFKRELGDSIYQYILKVQLEQAAHLLESEELTIELVAEKVGMESRSFYRLFQKVYHISPGEFRRMVRGVGH
ncbi:AraC family transcriptional regulator [Paenibacillus oryzisoli]|uniref:helix-turn-helix domain-containing protein n=1 Tax=Paenibacillus oryzisoli TaxID=1850517 RepID=UPI003D287F7D